MRVDCGLLHHLCSFFHSHSWVWHFPLLSTTTKNVWAIHSLQSVQVRTSRGTIFLAMTTGTFHSMRDVTDVFLGLECLELVPDLRFHFLDGQFRVPCLMEAHPPAAGGCLEFFPLEPDEVTVEWNPAGLLGEPKELVESDQGGDD